MAPKPFKLDTILKYRKRQKTQAQEKFAQAQIAFNKAVLTLETKKRSLNSLIESLKIKQETGILVNDLSRFEERIQYEREQLLLQQKSVAEKQKAANDRRQKLLEKSRDHKALNTLKKQQNLAWHSYLDKKDAAMLDEIAILRHDRRNN